MSDKLDEIAKRCRDKINTPGKLKRHPDGYQVTVIRAALDEAAGRDRAEIERLRDQRDALIQAHNAELIVRYEERYAAERRAEAAEAGQNHTACSRALAEAEDEVANWKARAEAAEAAHSKELAAHCHTSLKLAETQAEQEITQACNRRQFDRAENAETDRDRYAREANEWEHKTAEAWERRDAAEAEIERLREHAGIYRREANERFANELVLTKRAEAAEKTIESDRAFHAQDVARLLDAKIAAEGALVAVHAEMLKLQAKLARVVELVGTISDTVQRDRILAAAKASEERS